MSQNRNSTVRYRVPEAIPPFGPGGAGPASARLPRLMPIATSILWTPEVSKVPALAYPIFITRQALAAVHDHVAEQPGASSLGWLVGSVFQSPDTGFPYIVIESAIHLPRSIGGDEPKSALTQGRALAEEEAGRTGRELLGWYHGHVAADARLRAADMDAHLCCFDQPWHVALVVARGSALTGGVFRIAPDAAWSNEYLPFYELVEGDAVLAGGRKLTALTWMNYHAADAVSAERTSRAVGESQARVLFPEEAEAEDAPPALGRRHRAARVAVYGLLGVLATGALFAVFGALRSGPSRGPAAGPGGPGGPGEQGEAAAAISERIDGLADTLALSIAAFDASARLFDSRSAACPDLARGLVAVEERWKTYSIARAAAPMLDSARTARDRALYSDVDAAARRFDRSQCPRP